MERSLLVVDDEENLLVLLERIFRRDGYAVTTAHGSLQARDLIARQSFAAAILDIKMYPVDGVTLLGEIRTRAPATQVIMITAYPTSDNRDQCLSKGAAAFLTKPLDLEHLKKIVRELTAPPNGDSSHSAAADRVKKQS